MPRSSTPDSSVSTRSWRALRQTAIATAAGAGLLLGASLTHAVVVYSGTVNLQIPVTTNGLYLNVVNGANNLPGSTAGSTVAGWDINIWSTGGLGFFNPALPAGGAYVNTAPGFAANLAAGTLISAASAYSNGISTNTAQWNYNSANNLFGFRFNNEPGGTTHYGWARLSLGGTPNDPARTLVEYAFESTPGLAIQAGVIPEPGTYALMGLGMAGVLLAARRRART